MKIEDNTGNGYGVKVDFENRLHTKATSSSLQHHISENNNQAYQLSSEVDISTSEQDIILIKNTHPTKNLVVTYIRVEAIGAATPGENAYFNINVGGDYTSGGSSIIPINMFVGSAISADGAFYSGESTITSSGYSQIDRTYKDDEKFNKEGALILPKNASLTVSHKGSTSAGKAYCRLSFYYDLD